MPRLLILLTLRPTSPSSIAPGLPQKFPEIGIDVVATADKAAAALPKADMLLTFGQMMKNLKLDLAERRQPEMGAGARHRARRHHRPAGAEAERHGDEPARRARRAGVGGRARLDAGAVAATCRAPFARRTSTQWKRWPAKLLARQDRRHPRHRRDRRGAGAEVQGDGHDGGRHHVVAAPGRGLRPRASDGRAADGRCRSSITWCC